MNRHKQIHCNICMKTMWSNNLKRHLLVHEKHNAVNEKYVTSRSEESLTIEIHQSGNDTVDKNQYGGDDEEALRKQMLKCSKEYDEKINLGARVYKILGENIINPESIPPSHKDALDLFTKQKQSMDFKEVILRPWQEELIKLLEIPSDRQVIWVVGRIGGEGKTWFQEFVESKFAWNRVINGMDIKLKKSSICHVLRKRPLTTTDIFLFNVGKANTFDDVNYEVLEKIKDGKLVASKYDSVELRFKTPNVVVVFSNERPSKYKLSRDRWVIFKIEDDKLVDATNCN